MSNKMVNAKPYWYLRKMARVNGKPKMASEAHLGSADDIGKLHDAHLGAALRTQTHHLRFSDAAAVSGLLDRLDLIRVIDSVVGARRSAAGASVSATAPR